MEIWALVISILSAIGTCVAAYFAFRANTPKIKIEVKNVSSFSKARKYTAVFVELYNTSPVCETISDIILKTQMGTYHCKSVLDKKDIESLQIYNELGIEVDSTRAKLSTPIILQPFSYTFGLVLFFECVPNQGETVILNFQRASTYGRKFSKRLVNTTIAYKCVDEE